jgi:hypothetical protein
MTDPSDTLSEEKVKGSDAPEALGLSVALQRNLRRRRNLMYLATGGLTALMAGFALAFSSEIDALSRRGHLNLSIGSVTTISAVAILAYVALTSTVTFDKPVDALSHYIPRLTLVVLIQVFAFFFLKLYRGCLNDIKYFQNELTNVETKFVSLEAALIGNDADAIKAIVIELSKTERNFVLSKGQSTVELQKMRIENDGTTRALSLASEIIGKSKGDK